MRRLCGERQEGLSQGEHRRERLLVNGAEGETRTPTVLLPLDPESSASTKFRHFGIRGGVTLAITYEECQAAPSHGAAGSGHEAMEAEWKRTIRSSKEEVPPRRC